MIIQILKYVIVHLILAEISSSKGILPAIYRTTVGWVAVDFVSRYDDGTEIWFDGAAEFAPGHTPGA